MNLYATRKGTVETVNRFDFNGDGHLDLVFNSSHDFVTAPRVTCWEASNQRNDPGRPCELPAFGTSHAAVADLNKDGFSDLVLAPNDMWVHPRRYLLIFWGNGSGWSHRRVTNLITISPRAVEVADVNADGWPEIIVLNGSRWAPEDGPESVIRIYWNSAESFRQEYYADHVVPRATDLKVHDFDRDGRADLAVLQSDPGTVLFFWNSGMKPGEPFPAPTTLALGTASAARLVLADSNRDQRPDLFISGGKKERIGIDPTTGNETFRYSGIVTVTSNGKRGWNPPRSMEAPPASAIQVADLDHDDKPEIITADGSASTDSVKILWGRGNSSSLPVAHAAALMTADIDEDSHVDLVVGIAHGKDTYQADSVVYYGDGKGAFALSALLIPTADVTSIAIAPGSSGKGHRLVFCNNIAGRLREDVPVMLYWGAANGFSPDRVSKYSLRSGYVSHAADINQDGYADLLLSSIHHASGEQHAGAGFNILWGGSDGLKDDRRTVVPEFGLNGLSLGDLNRDGYLDLVGLCHVPTPEGDPARVVVWYGGAQGFSRQRRVVLPSEKIKGQIAVADFDKDGYLDLAVGRDPANRVSIFWGGPQGFSEARQTSWPLVAAEDMKAADLDGDGWLDLIAATYRILPTPHYDHGVYIYWGGPKGFAPTNVQRIEGYSAVGLTVADGDADGFLDIYLPNYHYGVMREAVASFLYWGSSEGYSEQRRTELMVDSGHGSMAGDFNSDGLLDLAVACHSRNGTHLTNSKVFYNDGQRFRSARFVGLPTVGTHYMQRADVGNLYDRSYRETYTSSTFSWDQPRRLAQLKAAATAPGKSRLEWAVRSARSKLEIDREPWKNLGTQLHHSFPLLSTARCLQYRATFVSDNGDRYPILDRVELVLSNTNE